MLPEVLEAIETSLSPVLEDEIKGKA